MDTVKRMKIQNLREKIVENVDVSDIIDHLISNEVVTEDEWDRIKAEGTYPWLSSELQADGPQAYQIEEKSYFDSLLLGGLPQAPPYYVERKEKIDEIRTHLHSLERGNYVVLHGMTGYGKSCLATAALDNKQLLIEKFNGAVYWISVGDATSDNLLCHMTDLMEKLSHHPQVEPEEMKVQSSISEKGATESLRRYFTSFALRDGLLILDDVPSSDFIDAFDIGCKILVTTKDREVMRTVEGRYNLITISKGFTEQESLSLIANCVGLSVSKLPPEAKKIHNLTKGTPMVIALIGAQLAEIQDDAKRNSGRWKYYVDNLTKRDYRIIRRNSFSPEKELFNAIGICVDILSEEMKSLYQDFALFVEDVNIKPEVWICTFNCLS
ncbi:hypothetical protein C0J52_10119 [Blattella germanica]|nr:hypothetical protein C0J52_10119 [Blattella germanica]